MTGSWPFSTLPSLSLRGHSRSWAWRKESPYRAEFHQLKHELAGFPAREMADDNMPFRWYYVVRRPVSRQFSIWFSVEGRLFDCPDICNAVESVMQSICRFAEEVKMRRRPGPFPAPLGPDWAVSEPCAVGGGAFGGLPLIHLPDHL